MAGPLRTVSVETTRFGTIDFDSDDLLSFPEGLIGLEPCRTWVLLADAENDVLGWLQSTEQAEIAMAVVSPRRILPEYQLRIARREIEPLELDDLRTARVLAIVAGNEQSITLNLKAPLVINLPRRIGRQVVANGNAPLRYDLPVERPNLKKSA